MSSVLWKTSGDLGDEAGGAAGISRALLWKMLDNARWARQRLLAVLALRVSGYRACWLCPARGCGGGAGALRLVARRFGRGGLGAGGGELPVGALVDACAGGACWGRGF